MKNSYIFCAALVLLLFLTACSTQKNTWGSRRYQELNTRYNVHFNGNEAYKQGIRQLKNGHLDDFSTLLPMYTVSNHTKAKGTAASMNKAIEKCQKAIKKHSIRVKPKKKPTSHSKESYKKFYSKEEFNPFMDDVFLLLANAQFHMADFNSSSATSTYIMRHFATDKAVQDKAAILLARSYKELGWMYEAENTLRDLNNSTLTPSQNRTYSAAYADFLITRKEFAEAIPYLKMAIKKASDKTEKQRWTFLLGQLYQETGQRNEANKVYSSIPGMNPPYEMEISARIRQTEVFPGDNPAKPLKKLKRLSRSGKNKDHLDQIHYAMGNLYLAAKDTAKALENFHLSLDKSTKYGNHKLKTLLVLGDLYYRIENFRKAAPCYADAEVLLKKEDERYPEAAFRSGVLKALAPELTIIHDEDSLQALAKLPEKELNAIIDSLVKVAEKKAREEKRKKAAEEALNENQDLTGENKPEDDTPTLPGITDPTNSSWYFYNESLVSKGLTDFQKKWGKRKLADDWRRNKKTDIFEQTAEESETTGGEGILPTDSLSQPGDSLVLDTTAADAGDRFTEGADDPLNPNFYLKDLPFTETQLQVSNEKIADALFNAGRIYREQMENNRLCLATFNQLETRFPDNKNLENAWYISYLTFKQLRRDADADSARIKLIAQFPESLLAQRLSDSLFIEHLIEMYLVEDSLYESAYKLFTQHVTDSIFASGQYVRETYPMTRLMPRFIFLDALEYGRTGQPQAFHDTLVHITNTYPESDLIPLIKEMLALWDSGRRPVPSAGYTSLFSLDGVMQDDEKLRLDSLVSHLTYEPNEPHVLLIRYPADSVNVNRLQFDVALYNFTTFLIRDYELSVAKIGQMDVLLVQGFENAADVQRYMSWINFQNEAPEIKYPGIKFLAVSSNNLKLLEEGVDPALYLEFFKKNYSGSETKP